MSTRLVRQIDHVLGDGTFRVGMTRARRVIVVIDVSESALGPLHLLFEVGPPDPATVTTGGLFGDLVHAVTHPADTVKSLGHGLEHAARDVGHFAEHAAEDSFNAAAKVATTVSRPAFNLVRDAAASGAHLIAQMPFVPENERHKIEAASRVIMRARLGDVTAKDFIRDVVAGAKAGVAAARSAGDALLTGTRVVAHVLDAPLRLAEHIPIIGGTIHALSPFQKLEHMSTAIQHGDFDTMKKIVTDDARMAAGVVALIPGIGSGIGAAIQTGLAILEGGGPLDIAVHAAYGAIPIPPGIRQVTDAVLEAVMKLAHAGSVTDAALAAARNVIPSGIPRDVFDTLVQLVVKRVPIHKAAEALVDHYVQQYAPAIHLPAGIAETVHHVANLATPAMNVVHHVTSVVDTAQHTADAALHGAAHAAVPALAPSVLPTLWLPPAVAHAVAG